MGFGGSERQKTVDMKPAMVGIMSTILHHKHPTSVTDTLALKSLLLTTIGLPGSVQRLENQLGGGFSRQTLNGMLSGEQLWEEGVSQVARMMRSVSDTPGFVMGADNVGKVRGDPGVSILRYFGRNLPRKNFYF